VRAPRHPGVANRLRLNVAVPVALLAALSTRRRMPTASRLALGFAHA
jgi:hypothetical protein